MYNVPPPEYSELVANAPLPPTIASGTLPPGTITPYVAATNPLRWWSEDPSIGTHHMIPLPPPSSTATLTSPTAANPPHTIANQTIPEIEEDNFPPQPTITRIPAAAKIFFCCHYSPIPKSILYVIIFIFGIIIPITMISIGMCTQVTINNTALLICFLSS